MKQAWVSIHKLKQHLEDSVAALSQTLTRRQHQVRMYSSPRGLTLMTSSQHYLLPINFVFVTVVMMSSRLSKYIVPITTISVQL